MLLAERKQSLGYDWHPECLRCEECGKRLNPGQHAEVSIKTVKLSEFRCKRRLIFKLFTILNSIKEFPIATCHVMGHFLDPNFLAMVQE